MDVSETFPADSCVKHKQSGKIGIVQAKFDGLASLFEPWEVPVKWRGDERQSVIVCENLERV